MQKVTSGSQQNMKGRPITERANVITNQALAANGPTQLGAFIPTGEVWYTFNMRFNHTVVIGTGAGPVAESELLVIKNILLKTDKGEIICNLPGRALYKLGTYKQGTPPRKDAMAAASATYRVTLSIYLDDWMMEYRNDHVLQTARYNSVSFQVSYGSVTDLFTAPGTATLAGTVDVEIERSHGAVDLKPKGHISYDYDGPVDASVQQFLNIERAADMAIKRLYVHACTSGTQGQPWSGANSDAIQSVISIKDQTGQLEKDRIHAMIQDLNKQDALLESIITGLEVFDFVSDRSIWSAMATGGKSTLQYVWVNQGGVAAGSLVSTAREMVRSLKN